MNDYLPLNKGLMITYNLKYIDCKWIRCRGMHFAFDSNLTVRDSGSLGPLTLRQLPNLKLYLAYVDLNIFVFNTQTLYSLSKDPALESSPKRPSDPTRPN